MVVGLSGVARCAVVGRHVARCAVVSGHVARGMLGFDAVGSCEVARCVQDVVFNAVRYVILCLFESFVFQELCNRCAMCVGLW